MGALIHHLRAPFPRPVVPPPPPHLLPVHPSFYFLLSIFYTTTVFPNYPLINMCLQARIFIVPVISLVEDIRGNNLPLFR